MIDCDIHNEVPDLTELYPYLPQHWVDYTEESSFEGPDANDYPEMVSTTVHPDIRDEYFGDGRCNTAARVRLIQDRVLDPLGIAVAVLNNAFRVPSIHSVDLAASMATAVNTWQQEQWLAADSRFRASIIVPSHNPVAAVQEIRRWQDTPGFVQVLLPVRSHVPYGVRNMDLLFEAIADSGLPAAINFGGAPGVPPTGVGWPQTYYEIHAGMAQVFQSQVMSMVYEGLFDRYPQLRIVLLEGGFTWAPSLMWRMNKEWKGLRHNVPWVRNWPADYIRTHFRWSLQPLDAPDDPGQLLEILDMMEADELLMFSTDFPHWQEKEVAAGAPAWMPEDLRRKVCLENPRAFYSLE